MKGEKVNFLVKLKHCRIGTQIGVVVDMTVMTVMSMMTVMTVMTVTKRQRQKDKGKKAKWAI